MGAVGAAFFAKKGDRVRTPRAGYRLSRRPERVTAGATNPANQRKVERRIMTATRMTIGTIGWAAGILLLWGCNGGPSREAPADGGTTARNPVIAKQDPDLPDLTEADVREILELARQARQGERVCELTRSLAHPSGTDYVKVAYDFHRTDDRVRRRCTVTFQAPDPGDPSLRPDDPRRTRWTRWDPKAWVETQVCPPGRSFRAGDPVPAAEILTLFVDPTIDDGRLLEIVDYMSGRHPAGERLHEIRVKEGAYEVTTSRGLEGSVFKVESVEGRWRHEQTGEWIS